MSVFPGQQQQQQREATTTTNAVVPFALATTNEHCDESFTNFLTAANQTKAGNKKNKIENKNARN